MQHFVSKTRPYYMKNLRFPNRKQPEEYPPAISLKYFIERFVYNQRLYLNPDHTNRSYVQLENIFYSSHKHGLSLNTSSSTTHNSFYFILGCHRSISWCCHCKCTMRSAVVNSCFRIFCCHKTIYKA